MRHLPILLLLGLVLAAGTTRAGPPFDPVLAELGAEAFPRYCASCHGVQAKGDGPAALALIKKPADLTRIAARRGGKFPDGEIARFIDGRFVLPSHGSREMPIWGERFGDSVPDSGVAEEVTRGKIAVLVEYLKSIQQKP
jgi:mono/diheme cytochrome c family protein